jgi:hypothetical protein
MPGMAGTDPASSLTTRVAVALALRDLVVDGVLDGGGEAVGAVAGQQPVRGLGHRARQQHRVLHTLHAGDGAEAALRIHDRRVHLDGGAVQAQHRTAAGIEAAVVFHHRHGGDRRFQCIGADRQFLGGARGGPFAAVVPGARAAGAAVHDDGESLCLVHSSTPVLLLPRTACARDPASSTLCKRYNY